MIKHPEPQKGTGAVEGAVFGLIGLILAFTLSGAQSWFDTRRAYIVEEANTISTTYDRADLLPEPHRATVKVLIRAYLGERIASYRTDSDLETRETHRRRAAELQREIWAGAELGCRAAGSSCPLLLLPSVNAMGDIATTRMIAQRTHVPWIIIVLMCILATCGAALAGYALAARSARRSMQWILLRGRVDPHRVRGYRNPQVTMAIRAILLLPSPAS